MELLIFALFLLIVGTFTVSQGTDPARSGYEYRRNW
jgi:hypothetical protein